MPFPLAEWIDGHAECRHNLSKSGMKGTIPSPVPSRADLRAADADVLRRDLSRDLGVDPARVFLTTGGSQANALATLFLARQQRGGSLGACRVCLPEYPPIFDLARWAGFRLTESMGAAGLAVISQPRNPEGDLWEPSRFLDWASGARSVVVDETFREFAGARSLLSTDRPGLWTTGSFTKFFAADDLRVGFVVAPEDVTREFARFHGLASNLLSPYSVAGATRALRDREQTRRRVRSVLNANIAVARAAFPNLLPLQAPLMFDRPGSGERGDALARRALVASVLVSSGSFFGDPLGVRLCLTRRTFPEDLSAYLVVRDRTRGRGTVPKRSSPVSARLARRLLGGTVRARAAPS